MQVWVERPLSQQLVKSCIESLIKPIDNSTSSADNSDITNISVKCMDDEGRPSLEVSLSLDIAPRFEYI
jgi:hypothetical protein